MRKKARGRMKQTSMSTNMRLRNLKKMILQRRNVYLVIRRRRNRSSLQRLHLRQGSPSRVKTLPPRRLSKDEALQQRQLACRRALSSHLPSKTPRGRLHLYDLLRHLQRDRRLGKFPPSRSIWVIPVHNHGRRLDLRQPYSLRSWHRLSRPPPSSRMTRTHVSVPFWNRRSGQPRH